MICAADAGVLMRQGRSAAAVGGRLAVGSTAGGRTLRPWTFVVALLAIICAGCSGGGGSSASIASDGNFTLTSSEAVVESTIDDFIFVDVEVNGAPARFILDTGADAFVVSRALQRRLGLEQVDTATITTIVGSSTVDVARIDEFRLGNVVGVDIDAAELDLGPGIDGIVGVPFFRATIVEIDYQTGLLTIRDPATFRLSEQAPSIGGSLLSAENFVLTNVSVDGQNVGAVRIDTGSSGGLRLASQAGASFVAQADETISVLSQASNGSIPGTAFVVDSLMLGDIQLEEQFVVVQDSPLEVGLLGGLVLRQFLVVLDLGSNQVLLRQDRAIEYALLNQPNTFARHEPSLRAAAAFHLQ
ncbi:MAG: retropepsin-like domain-containing protein [Bdellovibrionales bacterium]|nr:retropepsin-like domain-containing protein [Bdellovibrionales bacterium]